MPRDESSKESSVKPKHDPSRLTHALLICMCASLPSELQRMIESCLILRVYRIFLQQTCRTSSVPNKLAWLWDGPRARNLGPSENQPTNKLDCDQSLSFPSVRQNTRMWFKRRTVELREERVRLIPLSFSALICINLTFPILAVDFRIKNRLLLPSSCAAFSQSKTNTWPRNDWPRRDIEA